MLKLLKHLFTTSVIFAGEEAPLRAHLSEGSPNAQLAIVAGPNASGKSFAIRVLASWLNSEKPKVEPIQVSMKYRTMGGIHRAFMYGDDTQDSTGSNSMTAVTGGFRTAKGRTSPCWLMLDEPDVGLSEDFAYALGTYIANQVDEGLGEGCKGVVVVTHSRELVRGIVENSKETPHFAHVDDEPLTLQGWLDSSRRRSVEELLDIKRIAVERMRAIAKFLKD
jgi:hypothetical protein